MAFPYIIQIFIYLTQTKHHPFPVKKKMKFIEGNEIKERGYLKDSL